MITTGKQGMHLSSGGGQQDFAIARDIAVLDRRRIRVRSAYDRHAGRVRLASDVGRRSRRDEALAWLEKRRHARRERLQRGGVRC